MKLSTIITWNGPTIMYYTWIRALLVKCRNPRNMKGEKPLIRRGSLNPQA